MRERMKEVLNFLSTVGFLAVLGLLARLAFGTDPHWCSRDGHRFSCRARIISETDGAMSRWVDARASVTPDGQLYLRPRGLSRHKIHGEWPVVGTTEGTDPKRKIYVLRRNTMITIRVPAKSRCVPVLDSIVRK